MYDIYSIILILVVALFVASSAFQPILKIAKKHNIYDNPEARKLQRRPIPLLGGCVVFFGALVAALCYWYKHDCTSIIPVEVAMFVMLLLGTWDDMKQLSPYFRFAVEVVVVIALALVNNGLIGNLHGLWGIYQISPWVAWPLTVVSCVGIINAINMVDGIDGLSSGLCIMGSFFFGLFFFYRGDFVRAALAVAVVGALIPFFIVNVFGRRSKMFIGDGGTMMLGVVFCDFIMAMLGNNSMSTRQTPADFCSIAFALAVLAIPVFDTLRVMFGRIFHGISPFNPDKTHLHHAFIRYGFHHLETSLMEILLNISIVGVWWVIYKSHLGIEWQFYGVVIAALVVIVGLFYLLGRKNRLSERILKIYGITLDEYEVLSDDELEERKRAINRSSTD